MFESMWDRGFCIDSLSFLRGCVVLSSSADVGSARSDTKVSLALSPCVILWIYHLLSTLKRGNGREFLDDLGVGLWYEDGLI